jgi:hemerythrin-like domain-containing protein
MTLLKTKDVSSISINNLFFLRSLSKKVGGGEQSERKCTMKATQQLKDEHQGIKIVFRILEKICEKLTADKTLNTEHFEGILDFFKVFVDKCHHGKEEDLLFPAMEQVGIPRQGPIGVMLSEHNMGRDYVKAISKAYSEYKSGSTSASAEIINNSKRYISLMLAHIDKEDNVLYPMGDSRFSTEKDEELYQGFEKIEIERIGVGRHEAFHKMIETLMEIYLS